MIASVIIAIILIFATVCTGYNDDNAAGTGIQSEERTCKTRGQVAVWLRLMFDLWR